MPREALPAVFGGGGGSGNEEIVQRRDLAAVLLGGHALGRHAPARAFSAIRSIIMRSMNGSFMVMKVSTRSPSALKHGDGIFGEPADDVAIVEAALLVQHPREIPVIERDHRLDAGGEKVVDEAGIVVEAGPVDGADALGQHARPGDREAVGVDAELA